MLICFIEWNIRVIVMLILFSACWHKGFAYSKFPSLRAGWVLPGYAQDPVDNETLVILKNKAEVEAWEANHADIVYGGGLGHADIQHLRVVGYMYTQALSFDPFDIEMSFKLRALAENENYEDFFLHYTKDTNYRLPANGVDLGSQTSFYGRPWLMGFNNGPTHSGFSV
jgi:hypothetical protein